MNYHQGIIDSKEHRDFIAEHKNTDDVMDYVFNISPVNVLDLMPDIANTTVLVKP